MTTKDKTRLRDLAGTYAEYACGEPMAQRREKWRLHNRLEERTVPFHIEDNGSYFRDLTPPLECEGAECRGLEARLLHALVAYEKIDDELLMPHFARLADKFKLLKFGCCEPVHRLMPQLQRLNGLRKVSVTPWCDIRALAENCRRDIIWSRKPIPLKLCDEQFDPDDLRAHLQETLDVGRDYFVEFVYRDTNRLTGHMVDRVAQTCDIIRDLSGHPEGSRG